MYLIVVASVVIWAVVVFSPWGDVVLLLIDCSSHLGTNNLMFCVKIEIKKETCNVKKWSNCCNNQFYLGISRAPLPGRPDHLGQLPLAQVHQAHQHRPQGNLATMIIKYRKIQNSLQLRPFCTLRQNNPYRGQRHQMWNRNSAAPVQLRFPQEPSPANGPNQDREPEHINQLLVKNTKYWELTNLTSEEAI